MITKYLLLLGIGHILGDFYFQTEKISDKKDQSYKGVIAHSVEYLLSMLLVTIPVISLDMVLAAVIVSLAHFCIDSVKYLLLKSKKIRKTGSVFVLDQAFHVLTIFVMAYIMLQWNYEMGTYQIVGDIGAAFGIDPVKAARWILALLIIHVPANIAIQTLLSGYRPPETDKRIITANNRAGRMIGTIERLIMLIFIALDQYSAMGLVLTAKSIARYDKIAKEPRFAEYYLLGTLLSTVCVVLCKVVIL
ncbi:MAG: DUF3307 domain-containing protein [Lachnospiraceae bacterium]|nr:DUF3307 domain-containing protein [Lachnospiraceae bacterium]